MGTIQAFSFLKMVHAGAVPAVLRRLADADVDIIVERFDGGDLQNACLFRRNT